ncbi:MAG: S9 family peptidase, partial [Acidobacteriota bacterium]
MRKSAFVFLVAVIFLSSVSAGQTPYKLPPKEVVAILDAPPPPRPVMSPRGDMMVLVEYQAMPLLADLAQPLLRIGGLRITPQTNSRQQMIFFTSLTLVSLVDGKSKKVGLPEGIRMGMPQWSYDGQRLAFPRFKEQGVELWVVDAKTGEAKVVTPPILNSVLNSGSRWLPGSERLLAFAVPESRGNPPQPPAVPIGPNIEETMGKVSKVATYQDLLKTALDDSLFEFYATSQIIEIDIAGGTTRKIGSPEVYLFAAPSPDGNYLLVHKIKKPYSH